MVSGSLNSPSSTETPSCLAVIIHSALREDTQKIHAKKEIQRKNKWMNELNDRESRGLYFLS